MLNVLFYEISIGLKILYALRTGYNKVRIIFPNEIFSNKYLALVEQRSFQRVRQDVKKSNKKSKNVKIRLIKGL